MLVKNDFLIHWKVKLLRKRLGDGPALVALISLWAYCEQRRAWEFRLSPLELAGVCDYGGDAAELMQLLKDLRLITPAEDGYFQVNDWGELNSALVHKWPGRRLAENEYWHPRGRISNEPRPHPIAEPIAKPKGKANPEPIPQAIGLDRRGLDRRGDSPKAPKGASDEASSGELFGQEPTLVDPKSVSSRKKKKGGAPHGGSFDLPDEWTDSRRAALLEWFGYRLAHGSQITAERFASLREETAALSDSQLKACVEDAIRRHAKELSPHKFSGRQLDMFDDSSYIEEIYKAYPRKVGKPQALRAIAKAMRSVPIEGKKLLELTERYSVATAGWPDEDRQFIPHPATWFNGHRFNDDPAEWQRTQPASPQKKGGARGPVLTPEIEPVLKPEGDGEPNRYAEAWAALYEFDRPPWVHCPDSNRDDVLNWIESHGGDDV